MTYVICRFDVHAAKADYNQGSAPLITPSPGPFLRFIPSPDGFGLRPYPANESPDSGIALRKGQYLVPLMLDNETTQSKV